MTALDRDPRQPDKGGLVVVGSLNLGGSVDPVHNVNVAELAISKGASTLLVPVSARKQLNDLPDDMVTKVNILYFTDAREALLNAIMESRLYDTRSRPFH
jgi:ATP-dependent Lon protease